MPGRITRNGRSSGSCSLLRSSAQGHVFIYDKLNERVIDRAMDKNFERIDSMMFINVQKKKDNSNSPTDVNTHDDDDDC